MYVGLRMWCAFCADIVVIVGIAVVVVREQITDEELRRALHTFVSQFHASSKDTHSFTVIETAGGVLSPGPSSALQADLYRPFRHPVVLVGDTRLGGITSTLTALEALMLRGFSVHAICLILQPGATALINTEVIRRVSLMGRGFNAREQQPI